TGNSILGRDHFHKAASSKSVTKQCSLATTVFDGITIKVVDTPGWCDTELSEAELTQATVKCIDMSYPGPHVFLLILAIGNRFTKEEKETVQQIQEIFGERATRYTLILFTKGDDLEDTTFEDYLRAATADFKALIDKCGGRLSKLLKKIQDMVQDNGGGCYTNSTYQLLEQYKKREAKTLTTYFLIKKKDDLILSDRSRYSYFTTLNQLDNKARVARKLLHAIVSQLQVSLRLFLHYLQTDPETYSEW
uniref:AIG1-type G domain-containing protein n=1 Tax=Sinocyclocheilus rhinocerous TaxID=307959 RepID=A0A673FQA7_9TELE